MSEMKIAFETGKKRTFVSTVDWLGWRRSGRDEDMARLALIE